MILIHRSEPLVQIGGKRVRLSRNEYLLLCTFGMMNDRVISTDLLLQATFDHPLKGPDDINLILNRLCRLRKKLGKNLFIHKRKIGYRLAEEIRFIDNL